MKTIGRNNEANEIWSLLRRQSVVLSSLRRMGKTKLLEKMHTEPPGGWQAVMLIVQGLTSVEEFTQKLYAALVEAGHLDGKVNAVSRFYDKVLSGQKIGTFQLPDLKQHWKTVLTSMFSDLAEKKELNLAVLLDEFPWFIYNLATTQKAEKEAIELLDTLRTVRQQTQSNSGLRFVFCGSVGFHVAVNHLVHNHHYLGNPTNDMHTYLLYEMSEGDALELCRALGLVHRISDSDDLFAYIATSVQNLPFFINLVFEELSKNPAIASREKTDKIIADLIRDQSGNGHFSHFLERLDEYYGVEQSAIAYTLLGHLCHEDQPQSRIQLVQAVLLKKQADEKTILQVVKDLYTDFYLQLDDLGCYCFRYELLRRWWRMHYG